MAKGVLEINSNDAALTFTHVWESGAWRAVTASDFSENSPIGEDNPMEGTVTGSNAGSTLFGHLVKQ